MVKISNSRRGRRPIAVTRHEIVMPLVVLLLGSVLSLATSTPAQADPCTGSTTQAGPTGQASAICTAGTGGKLPPATPGTYRQGAQYPDMACNYRNNPDFPSNYGVLFMLGPDGAWHYVTQAGAPRVNGEPLHCMRPTEGAANRRNITLNVPIPTIETGFSGRLLYNAPVEFTIDVDKERVGADTLVAREIPEYKAILTFQAKKVVWDFGDGTTAEGASVTHVFQNAVANNEVKVQATVTWEARLSTPGQRAFDAPILGEEVAQAELVKQIVQVHAVPTEPNAVK